ncbi:MAG: trigger factor [Clostridiales bacterium]|nr:trigger factor [Clostridiales bacterium]
MSSFEKNEKNQAVITVEIDGGSFEKAVDTAYKKTASRYAVPGFRKGKAPRRLVEKYYGEAVFFEDAFNEAFPEAYEKAIEELKLTPVSRPDIEIADIKEDKTVVFKATVDLKPEVTLGKYKGIKIKKNEYTVSDEDIEKELKMAQERVARMVEVERPVQNGDTVTLNYSGSVDGVAFAGGTAENQKLVIGSGSFIPGFEDQMIGMVKGEERELNVKFPEEYHAEDLKGKDAVFAVKVLEIQEKQMPEIDDEFAKDVSEFDTLEDYKKDIAAKQKEKNDARAQTEFENALIDKICEEATVEIPDSMVQRQLDYQIRDMEMRLSYQGLKMEDYLKYTGTTMEQMRALYKDDAAATVKRQLVIEAIKNAENIAADEESIDKEIARYAEMFKKDAAEYKATLKEDELEYISESVAVNKTLEFIKANNKPAAKRAPAKKKTAETETEPKTEETENAEN